MDDEFVRKLENRGIKIARVNSILITKSINLQSFTLFLYGVMVCGNRMRFSVHSQFMEKSMEVLIILATNSVYYFFSSML